MCVEKKEKQEVLKLLPNQYSAVILLEVFILLSLVYYVIISSDILLLLAVVCNFPGGSALVHGRLCSMPMML